MGIHGAGRGTFKRHLAVFENGPLDSRLWSAEIRTVVNKVGMYTIGPIAKDGEVYAQHMELNTSRI